MIAPRPVKSALNSGLQIPSSKHAIAEPLEVDDMGLINLKPRKTRDTSIADIKPKFDDNKFQEPYHKQDLRISSHQSESQLIG